MQKPTVGIIGGAGPLATLNIENNILSFMKALVHPLTDQDYFNMVTFNYCDIYDRNDTIFYGQSCPLNQYIKYIELISALEVDLILLGCNTAHVYLPILREKTKIPIISLIEETIKYLHQHYPTCKKVGLISTTKTREKGLYHQFLFKTNIDIVEVSSNTQNAIMEAIYIIKSGIDLSVPDKFFNNCINSSQLSAAKMAKLRNHPHKSILLQSCIPNPKYIIENAIKELIDLGSEYVVLACTELPLVLPYLDHLLRPKIINPNSVIAEAVVNNLLLLESHNNGTIIKKKKCV